MKANKSNVCDVDCRLVAEEMVGLLPSVKEDPKECKNRDLER